MSTSRKTFSFEIFACAVVTLCSLASGGCGSKEEDLGDRDPNERGKDTISLGGSFQNSDGGASGSDVCGGETVQADPILAHVLMLVDASASMSKEPAEFETSKWNTLVDSLDQTLPRLNDQLHLGLKLYPSGDTSQDICGVESGVEVDVLQAEYSVPAIQSALQTRSPSGDTPTAAALGEALRYFEGSAGQQLDGDKYVLLATDGGPNCSTAPKDDCTCDAPADAPSCGIRDKCTLNLESQGPCTTDGTFGSCCDVPELCLDDQGTLDAVQSLRDAGVKTIVLGMPGSEAYTNVLDALATAGGMASDAGAERYLRVDNPSELSAALESVTQGVIRSCTVALAEPPPTSLINVYVDGEVLFKDDQNGWLLNDDPAAPTVEVVGDACAQVEREGVGEITVRYGCQTIVR